MAVSSYLTAFTSLYPNSTTATVNTATVPGSWSSSGARCNVCHSSGGGTDLNEFGRAWRDRHNAGRTPTQAYQDIEGVNSDGSSVANKAEIDGNAQPGWRPGPNNSLYDIFGAPGDAPLSTGNNPPTTLVGLADPVAAPPPNQPPVIQSIPNQTVNENQLLTVTPVASDPDAGQTLTFSGGNLPTGAAVNPATGVLTWTPSFAQAGNYPNVTITATDNGSPPQSASRQFTITVGNTNRPPVLNAIPNQTAIEGQLLTVTPVASDPDGDALTFTGGNLPTGATLNAATGVLTWTPSFTQAGNYPNVTITATDNGTPAAASATQTFAITVGNVNQPPVLNPIGNQTASENQLLAFQATATDPDVGDALTFSAGSLPTGATFTPAGAFSWTPSFTQAGNYTVVITVADNGSPVASDSETITITVNNVNRPPVLAPIGNKTATVGQLLTFTASASDPDGNTVTFSSGNLPTGATLNATTGAFAWTPAANQVGTVPVTITATDNGTPNLSASETIQVTVGPGNRPPVLDPIGNRTVDEGQTLAFTATASDPDGDALTFSATGLPAGATLSPAGAFSWTPSFTQAGNHSVTIIVTDPGGLTDSETITITVGNVNRPPVLNPIGNKTGTAGQPLTFTATASDPDGDAMTFSATGLPAGATLSPAGAFSWTPTAAQTGNFSVTITVTDNGSPAASASETITITVGQGNRPPVLNPIGNKTVAENALLTFTATASDPDGGPLTFSATGLPAGATLNATTGVFSWTPGFNQAGSYPVTITVTDNGGLTASETITITVDNTNRAPTATNPGNKTVTEGQLLSFAITGTDPDGNALTFDAGATLPAGATLSPAGAFSWTPAAGQAGTYPVTVTATDDGSPALTSSPVTFTITVSAPGAATGSVRISEAKAEERELEVEGRTTPGGVTVTILDAATGATLGTVRANSEGKFELELRLSTAPPCTVQARTSTGALSAVVPVRGACGNGGDD